LLYSSRTYREIVYREELDSLSGGGQGVEITHTLTREQPPGWTGEQRRIDRTMLASAGFPASARPRAYICGPTPLVEQVAADLVSLGYPEALVKTERFGPTGDPQ
jgi:ferredoxin-NADP reductase